MAENPIESLPINLHHEIVETFADQIGTMYFDGTSLRVDLLVTRVEKPSIPPAGERHVVSRLVLSPRCTAELITQLSKISAQLHNSGIFKADPPSSS
jgi:hypothetical protein